MQLWHDCKSSWHLDFIGGLTSVCVHIYIYISCKLTNCNMKELDVLPDYCFKRFWMLLSMWMPQTCLNVLNIYVNMKSMRWRTILGEIRNCHANFTTIKSQFSVDFIVDMAVSILPICFPFFLNKSLFVCSFLFKY